MIYVSHLSLANFRNYAHLELDLPRHLVVLKGGNAQGKSNLLEGIYFLATARSYRGATERELLNWCTPREGIPVARLFARVERAKGRVEVEVALRGTYASPEQSPSSIEATHVQKRIRLNGIQRRALDLVGQLNVVMFGSQDIELVGGSPSLRRRYLDLANCQLDPRYLRSLQRYNKVLLQRNRLLRLIGERRAEPDQLDFWDGELAEAGSYLMLQRHLMVAELDRLVQPIHHQLTTGKEELSIAYLPSMELKSDGLNALSSDFRQRLRGLRRKEVEQGMSLAGPHRDDLRFSVHDVDMNVFASRGQQRTIALSLKLAEARFMHSRMDDHPVILLDDVLSELDPVRCHQLLEAITSCEQVVITATDLDRFDPHFLAQAALFAVREGKIEPV